MCQINSNNLYDEDNNTDPETWAPQDFFVEDISITTKELNWKYADRNISGFKIDRKQGVNDWQYDYVTLSKKSRSWTDIDLTLDSDSICYKIYAFAGENKSAAVEVNVIKFPSPRNLHIRINDLNSITLEWDYKMTIHTGYKLDRKIGNEEWEINYATLDPNLLSYTDRNVKVSEQIISYRLYAYDGNIKSKDAEIMLPFGIEMIFVGGGAFIMGCTSEQGKDCFDNEKPTHQVTLSDYYIGKYEITQTQWTTVMQNNPSVFIDCDSCPVEWVSWDDCQIFIEQLK